MTNDITTKIGLSLEKGFPAAQASIEIRKHLIDLSEVIDEPEPLITRCGKVVLSRNDFITIAGAQKVRKSFLISSITAGFLGSEDALGFESDIVKGICLFVDTEQSRPFVQKAVKRMHQQLEWDYSNNDRLIALALRELDTKERSPLIEKAIEMYKPDLVIVDGAVDLLEDFNSIPESNEVKQFFLRITTQYNCGLITVIHENKTNNQMRGNLGAFLAQKGLGVLSVKAEGNHSTVTPTSYRTLPPDEFHFNINSAGLPELLSIDPLPTNVEKYRTLFEKILPKGASISYSQLRDEVMSATDVKVGAAEKRIKKALDSGIVQKNEFGKYYMNYPDEDTSLPF